MIIKGILRNNLKIIIYSLFSILFLVGCATTYPIPAKDRYQATTESKNKLIRDLRSGGLKIGTTLDYIKSTYGEPEKMSVYDHRKLIIYRRPVYYDSIYLWFDNGKHLSGWSN